MKENTFGEYEFESWVPEHTREIIREFWGCFGRTYEDWLKNGTEGLRLVSHHGPNPNGFGNPPMGSTAIYLLRDYTGSELAGYDLYRKIKGRYIHRWNNMGSLIDDKGIDHTVSSCDYWIRVFTNDEEKEITLS